MDVAAELTELDDLITLLRVQLPADAKVRWREVMNRLTRLEAAAACLGLPTSRVREYTMRLRRHLGTLLAVVKSDGHSIESHVVWAIGAMKAMRSDHAFGPALERLAASPSGALH